MSTITQSSQPIIIPDPSDPNYGPSADNIPVPSSSPGAPVTNTIGNGNAVTYYTIANNFLRQPTAGAGYTYRFTFNGYIENATVAGAGGPIICSAVLIHPDTTTEVICSQQNYVLNTAQMAYCNFSMSGIFIPLVGDIIRITLTNVTGGTLTGATLRPTPRGCGIELVSKSSAPVLIFS